MVSFVDNILLHHINKEPYLLAADGLSIEPADHPSVEKRTASAIQLLQLAVDRRHSQGFSSEETRKLACCAYQSLHHLPNHPAVSSELVTRKKREALWNLIGREVQREDDSTKLFEKLVVTNHIHYMVNRFGLSSGGEAVSILVNGRWIPLSELAEKACDDGVEFYHRGALVFQTTKDYILDKYFFCGDRGIIPKTPQGTEAIESGFLSTPADNAYHVIVGTALLSQEAPHFLGDHGYLGLVDMNGRTTYFGQYGMTEDPSCSDSPTSCAHKSVGIEGCDRYVGLPFTSYHVRETKLRITKDQYERLKKTAMQDITRGRLGSILDENCSEYVVRTLKGAGIQATARMTALTWLWKRTALAIFPRSLAEKISRGIDALPKWLFRLLHYVPVFYIPNVLFGLCRTLMSYEKRLGYRNIFHIQYFLQSVFCPWSMFVNHPLALRAWQITQENKSHGY